MFTVLPCDLVPQPPQKHRTICSGGNMSKMFDMHWVTKTNEYYILKNIDPACACQQGSINNT